VTTPIPQTGDRGPFRRPRQTPSAGGGRQPASRHRDIVVFSRDPIEARVFDGWGMASARTTPAVKGLLDDLMADQTPSPARVLAIMREAIAAI